jgi:hypothetical protein
VANFLPKKHWRTSHQSTIGRLQNALIPENNYKQFIGEVNYIDYKRSTSFDDMFFPFLFKKKLSIWAEVRIITDVAENTTLNDGPKNVDIDQLIETIYIHPKSENWYKKPSHWFGKTTRLWLRHREIRSWKRYSDFKIYFYLYGCNWIPIPLSWQVNNYNAQHHFIELSILLVSSTVIQTVLTLPSSNH